MLAEYTLKMTLSNSDFFALGVMVGFFGPIVTFLILTWIDKK